MAKVLGVSPSSGYELMHEKDFPTLRIGNRMVMPRELFIQWVELIVQMQAEIAFIKASSDKSLIPNGVIPKKYLIGAYMRAHPDVTNKSQIAHRPRRHGIL